MEAPLKYKWLTWRGCRKWYHTVLCWYVIRSVLGNGWSTSGVHNTILALQCDCSSDCTLFRWISGVQSLDMKLLQTHALFEVSVTVTTEVSIFYDVTNVSDQHSASILRLEQKATISSRRRNALHSASRLRRHMSRTSGNQSHHCVLSLRAMCPRSNCRCSSALC
jgi:hypothetical protein